MVDDDLELVAARLRQNSTLAVQQGMAVRAPAAKGKRVPLANRTPS